MAVAPGTRRSKGGVERSFVARLRCGGGPGGMFDDYDGSPSRSPFRDALREGSRSLRSGFARRPGRSGSGRHRRSRKDGVGEPPCRDRARGGGAALSPVSRSDRGSAARRRYHRDRGQTDRTEAGRRRLRAARRPALLSQYREGSGRIVCHLFSAVRRPRYGDRRGARRGRPGSGPGFTGSAAEAEELVAFLGPGDTSEPEPKP